MQRFTITIGREYGSGGRLIGEKVARELGIAFYNRNLIDLTAKRSGLAEGYISKWEERVSSRFIWSNTAAGRGVGGVWVGGYYSNEDKMFITQSQIIRELAEKEACVIVGRCADYVLRESPHCVNVFIRADMEHRIERLTEQYGVDPAKAAETAANTDKGRANYYKHYTGARWGDGRQHHLVVDSGRFGIDGATALIVQGVHSLYPELRRVAE